MPACRRIHLGRVREPEARVHRWLDVTPHGLYVRYEYRGLRQTRRYGEDARWTRTSAGDVRIWDAGRWDVLRLGEEQLGQLPPGQRVE